MAKIVLDGDGTASIAWNGAEVAKKNIPKDLGGRGLPGALGGGGRGGGGEQGGVVDLGAHWETKQLTTLQSRHGTHKRYVHTTSGEEERR